MVLGVERSNVKVLGLWLGTAIRRGFELYECLLVSINFVVVVVLVVNL